MLWLCIELKRSEKIQRNYRKGRGYSLNVALDYEVSDIFRIFIIFSRRVAYKLMRAYDSTSPPDCHSVLSAEDISKALRNVQIRKEAYIGRNSRNALHLHKTWCTIFCSLLLLPTALHRCEDTLVKRVSFHRQVD